jgi:TPR repeat protein
MIPIAFAFVVVLCGAGLGVAAPASPSTAPSDVQRKWDDERFDEWLNRYGGAPTPEIVERIVRRAKDPVYQDRDALFWAGIAAASGLVDSGTIDARECIERAAELGHPAAEAAWVANFAGAASTLGQKRDAAALLDHATAAGDRYACFVAGQCFAKGAAGLPKNVKRGRELLEKALSQHCERASVVLAELCLQQHDEKGALEYRRRAAFWGDRAAIKALFEYYTDAGPTHDESEALKVLERGSLMGESMSMFMLATQINDAKLGLPKDPPMARQLLFRAARNGFVTARLGLAGLRLDGSDGLPAEPERACREMERLWVEGNADALAMLGIAVYEGTGRPKDTTDGVQKLHVAAANGSENARNWLREHHLDDKPAPELKVAHKDPVPPPSERERLLEALDEFHDYEMGMLDEPSERAINLVCKVADEGPSGPEAPLVLCRAGVCGLLRWRERPRWREELRRAAEMGEPIAQATWGDLLVRGHGGVPKDLAAGVSMVQRSADNGNGEGLQALAMIYARGEEPIVKKEEAKAEELLKRAREAGLTGAVRYQLSLAEKRGDKDQADRYRLEAAKLGDPTAMWMLAMAEVRGPQPDVRKAFPYFQRGALWGNPTMCRQLAVWTSRYAPDPVLCRRLLTNAADLNNAGAKAMIAAAHVTGEFDFVVDADRGMAALRALVDTPISDARWHLGRILYDGMGVPADKEKGLAFMKQAAAAGSGAAQERLKEIK